jgi:hypothetical protein
MIELAITIIAVFFLLCVFSALLGVVVGLLQLLCEFLAVVLEFSLTQWSSSAGASPMRSPTWAGVRSSFAVR